MCGYREAAGSQLEVRGLRCDPLSPLAGRPPADDLNLRSALGDREKDLVEEALRRSGGVRKEAARLLGIDQRNLGYYLRKHAIDPDKTS